MSNLWDTSALKPCLDVVVPGETMAAVFWNGAAQRAQRVLMREKKLGIWRDWTWSRTAEAVREVGNGLLALGFAPGDCASILANTVVEWVLADLAVLSCGGVSNGIYPTDAPAQVEYLSFDSQSRLIFVEDDEQLDKVLAVRERLPRLEKIVVFDTEGLRDFHDPAVLSLDALRELGRAHGRAHPDGLDQRVAGCRPDDLAILVYTSGTTGKPKGAMHSHAGIVYTVRGYNTIVAQKIKDVYGNCSEAGKEWPGDHE